MGSFVRVATLFVRLWTKLFAVIITFVDNDHVFVLYVGELFTGETFCSLCSLICIYRLKIKIYWYFKNWKYIKVRSCFVALNINNIMVDMILKSYTRFGRKLSWKFWTLIKFQPTIRWHIKDFLFHPYKQCPSVLLQTTHIYFGLYFFEKHIFTST